jgi:SSS family solute:Na+ symporter
MDIYKQYINKTLMIETSKCRTYFRAVALLIVIWHHLGWIDQAFQFIQEYTGVVSPGILAVFILGLFWKKHLKGYLGRITFYSIAMFLK